MDLTFSMSISGSEQENASWETFVRVAAAVAIEFAGGRQRAAGRPAGPGPGPGPGGCHAYALAHAGTEHGRRPGREGGFSLQGRARPFRPRRTRKAKRAHGRWWPRAAGRAPPAAAIAIDS